VVGVVRHLALVLLVQAIGDRQFDDVAADREAPPALAAAHRPALTAQLASIAGGASQLRQHLIDPEQVHLGALSEVPISRNPPPTVKRPSPARAPGCRPRRRWQTTTCRPRARPGRRASRARPGARAARPSREDASSWDARRPAG